MKSRSHDEFAKEFEGRFAWRESRQIDNLRELADIAPPNTTDPFEAFPGLIASRVSSDPRDALRWSILYLFFEGIECYVFGQFQSCILTCGSIVERALKLEYAEANGKLPKGRWTLGKCIHGLDWSNTRVTAEIINLAKQLLDPRNNRAHAYLEHSNPMLSIMGGPERGIDMRGSGYLIEPYRGDAKNVIRVTLSILARLYG